MRRDNMGIKRILAFLLALLLCFGGGMYDAIPARAQGEPLQLLYQ
ncbi:hypothetical protein [Novisyntrophococcus fermenticellae]|nr:hypothetical protein [Novisyntrophococcus fermenticellae]